MSGSHRETLTPGFHDVADARVSDLPGFSSVIIAEKDCTANVHEEDLIAWFSEPRMERYLVSGNPVDLYLWDTRLAKAYLEDIAHVEVLLRNFIADRLEVACEKAYGDKFWYDKEEHFNLSQKFVEVRDEVKERLVASGKSVTPSSMTAGFSLGTWLFMLSKSHEPTVWRALRARENGGMPNYPARDRRAFQEHVETIWRLRNRCAHHEHLAGTSRSDEARFLDTYSEAIYWVADRIDPRASDWIKRNSRVSDVRAMRPSSGAAGKW